MKITLSRSSNYYGFAHCGGQHNKGGIKVEEDGKR